MTILSSKTAPQIVGALAAAFFYGLFFWRTVRSNPGNRLIECGVMAIALALAMAFLSSLVRLPDWAFGSMLLLIFLLSVATLFFLGQRAYRALSGRGTRQRT